MSTETYMRWQQDPTPDNMGAVLTDLDPIINSEIHRYTGPKPLLRSKAKALTINAIKSYKPSKGAQLHSWVVTQLQPLARYNNQLRPVKASEDAVRQAAELNRKTKDIENELGRAATLDELADELGISQARIKKLRSKVVAPVTESTLEAPPGSDDVAVDPALIQPNKLDTAEEIVYGALNDRDKAIYDWKIGRHGKPTLMNQLIAKRLGVTAAFVSQRTQQIAQQINDLVVRGMV